MSFLRRDTPATSARLAVATGALSDEQLSPDENWPQLYETCADVVAHQTSDPD